MPNSYHGETDAEKVIYLNNFAAKIGGYASLLDIAAADVTQTQDDALNWELIVSFVKVDETHHHQVVTYKDHMRHANKAHTALGTLAAEPTLPVFTTPPVDNIFGRNANLVARIKKHTKYTAEIGKDLGIIAAGTGTGTHSTILTGTSAKAAVLKPVLIIHLHSGNPYLRWHKGKTHLLRILVDRGDGKGFVLLVIASHFSYTDKFALPAIGSSIIWKYKAVYLDSKEDPIGEWSEVAEATVKGV
ncbi:MAG: hypothetical protein ACYDCN_05455 [Bacteroidia bacterium]